MDWLKENTKRKEIKNYMTENIWQNDEEIRYS
jgi:hypothetical protein